jgi:hypothetical protein
MTGRPLRSRVRGSIPPLPTVWPDEPPPAGRLLADPLDAVPDEEPDDPERLVAVVPLFDPDVVRVRLPDELEPEDELPEDELPDVELPDEEELPEEVELPRGTAWSPDDPEEDEPEEDEPAEDELDDELPEEGGLSRGTAWPADEPDEAEPPRCMAWANARVGTAKASATVRLSTTRVDRCMARSWNPGRGIHPLPLVQLYCQTGRS